MKIDYDRPVTGPLADGFYWAVFSGHGSEGYPVRVDMACVISEMCVMHHWSDHNKRFPHCRRNVSEWREIGWQFYRARLPRPKRGAR
jgi:hypothetical protein